MDFERTHKAIAYLLVGTGFLVLVLSGELPPILWMIGVPAIVGSIFWGGKPPLSSTTLWNTLLIAALGGLFALALSTGDWLRNAIYFASLMVIAKLYQKLTSRDYLQLYALSFLQLVSGAVINPTLSFALCFLAYVVFLTWALVLLHLRRDMDRLAELRGGGADDDDPPDAPAGAYGSRKMRQLIGPGFLAGTSALALVIFASSIVVFLFFPRLGLGFFGQHRTTGTPVSGFDPSGMQLGNFGRLKQDQTVIMRVEIDGAEARDMLPLRMKGISFDRYENNTWTKSENLRWRLARSQDGFVAVRHWGYVPEDSVEFLQRVFLENINISRKTIFGEARMTAVRDLLDDRYVFDPRRRTRFFQDGDEDVVFHSRSGSAALRYEVKSYRIKRHPELLRQAPGDFHGSLNKYLQLPADLDPRIPELAREVTRGATTHFDRVAALEKHLLASYAYSLEGGHDPDEPLVDFLFGIQKGHCEYFSSAMVVMARSLGIPARPAGGFFGGSLNDEGVGADYIAMRQADAHSWVEVWFQGYGWQVFDPTPPSGALVAPEEGFFAQIGRYLDSLELLWYKWVIRWDLERQLDFLRGIGKQLDNLRNVMPDIGGVDKKWGAPSFDLILLVLGIFGLLAGWFFRHRILAFVRRRGRTSHRSDRDAKAVRGLYRRLVKLARKRGVDVTPATSALGLVRALRQVNGYAAEQAAPVVRLYTEVVFGHAILEDTDVDRAKAHLRAIEKGAG